MQTQSLPLLGEAKRKRSAELSLRGEADSKRIAETFRRELGQAIARAIRAAGFEQKEVAGLMEYEDGSALTRWIAGAETAQLHRLWMVEGLRKFLVIELAGLADGIDVTTTISIRRAG